MNIKGRTDPTLWMHVVCVKSSSLQKDRPASRKANLAIAPWPQKRMRWIHWRQAFNVSLHCCDDHSPERSDLRIDLGEKRSVGLRSTADRLIQIFALSEI